MKIYAALLLLLCVSTLLVIGVGNHGHWLFRPHMREDWWFWGTALVSGLGGVLLFWRAARQR